ncbi:MAG: ankyrin repeat domain-containing protein [Wolbachia endosymbiont of Xenopsylla cheopis]
MIGLEKKLTALEKQVFEAVRDNNIEGVTEILGLGVSINTQDDFGRTPILLATLYDHLSMMARLVELGADLEIKDNLGDTVLSKMLSRRYQKGMRNISKEEQLFTIKFLVASGAKLTTYTCGSLPIHIAIKERRCLNVIRILLTEDNINEQDSCKHTPLYSAISSGRIDVVKFLLQCKKIDVNINIGEGCEEDTPLILAAKKQYVEVVVLLLFCGAIPSQTFLKLKTSVRMQILIQNINSILSQGACLFNPYHKYLLALYKEYQKNKRFTISFKPTLLVSKLHSCEPQASEQYKILSATTNRSVISDQYRVSSVSSPGLGMYEELRHRMLDTATPRSVISEPPRPFSVSSITSIGLLLGEQYVNPAETTTFGVSQQFSELDVDSSDSSISEVSTYLRSSVSSHRSSISEVSTCSGSSISSFSPSGSYAVDSKRKRFSYTPL